MQWLLLKRFFLKSALHVDDRLEHLVADRDDLGVRLEAALRDDHIGELVRDVNVRHLERRRRDRATEVGCRLDVRRAGVVRLLVEAVARLREAGCVRELRDGDLRL